MRLLCTRENTVVVLPRERVRRFYQPGWHTFEEQDWPHVQLTNIYGMCWRRPTWDERRPGDVVLLVRDGGLGDLLMLTPTLRHLAGEGLRVRLVCYECWSRVFDGNPNVERVTGTVAYPGGTAPSYDCDFHFELCNALESYGDPVLAPMPRIDRFLWTICGQVPPDKHLDFQLDPEGQAEADALLAPLEGRPFAALCARSHATGDRAWLPEYVPEFVRLMAEAGMATVRAGFRFPEAFDVDGVLDLRGCTPDLHTLAGVLNRAAVVVSPDTGTLHLGAALSQPVLGLFTDEPMMYRVTPYYDTLIALHCGSKGDLTPERVVRQALRARDRQAAAGAGPEYVHAEVA